MKRTIEELEKENTELKALLEIISEQWEDWYDGQPVGFDLYHLVDAVKRAIR